MRPADVRPGVQAGRRAAARHAGPAHPHRDRGRRVRRLRRPGHHRGHPRGDRRRDRRRARRRSSARRSRSCPTAPMRVTARLPVEDLAELFRRRAARGRRRRDRRRPAGPGARPGADRGRRRPRSAGCSWSPRAPADGATGSTRCWSAGCRARRADADRGGRSERPGDAAQPAARRAEPADGVARLTLVTDLPARGRQARHPRPLGPRPHRRAGGGGRPRHRRPHLPRRHRRAALAAAVRAAGRGRRRGVQRGRGPGGGRGGLRGATRWSPPAWPPSTT